MPLVTISLRLFGKSLKEYNFSVFKLFKFRKFNLQVLIYKCRKYVSYLPPC